jgi:hypothetical protein
LLTAVFRSGLQNGSTGSILTSAWHGEASKPTGALLRWKAPIRVQSPAAA